jgi:hypothetical protein
MLSHFYLFHISGAVSGGKSEIGHCGGINNPVHYVRYFITAMHKVNIYTDKKENEIFLIYKEIQMGSVAKSYIRKGFLIY